MFKKNTLRRDDYVALYLPNSESDTGNGSQSNRKSYRRYWNQLSRCQRNLIISAAFAVCVTLFLFLPSQQITTKSLHLDKTISSTSVYNLILPPDAGNDQIAMPRILINEENLSNNNNEPIKIETPNNIIEHPIQQIEPQLSQPEQIGSPRNLADFVKTPTSSIEFVNKTPLKFKGPQNKRQTAVVNAFLHSWHGYRAHAWGHDNLKPISKSSYDWFGLGLTIVDSLDTLYILDLKEEFLQARNWVDEYLTFDKNRGVNLFEITIRVLGGLLSAYHLSGDSMFLKKAVDLGNRLLPCFNSPSGIPYSDVNLKLMSAHSPSWSPDSSTSEVTTLQLEFRELSRLTGNKSFEEAVETVNAKVHHLEKNDGLVPIFINANTGLFRNFATITLGARGDSYYEYLLKQWIQTGKQNNDFLKEDYKKSIDGIIKNLAKKTSKYRYTFIGELINGKDFKPKMDHLACFLPGTLLLGYSNGLPESHFKLATDLLETCLQTYLIQPTGLAAEISYFRTSDDSDSDLDDIYVKPNDAHNLLRPEFIESLYYFYAITGNKTYQDWGWRIFNSFMEYTKVEHGFTSIGNVQKTTNTRPRDMMESFWLGETLKYFYLLFSDNRKEIDLEKFVINTEAHPLPIYTRIIS